MKKIIAALLCITLIISFSPVMVIAGEGGGSLNFFFADNFSGKLSFDYSHPSALSADVRVVKLPDNSAVYSQTHTLSNGELSLSDIPINTQGSFRLSITAGSDVVTHDFTNLPRNYTETFPTLTKAGVKAELTDITSASHPYLFANASQFEALASKIHSGTDAYLVKSYDEIKEYAATIRDGSVSSVDTSSVYITRGFQSWKNVMFSAFVYLMDKDTSPIEAAKYAARAYNEASYLCNLSTWGTNQYIDNNQLAFAVALCYDWLYDWLDDTQKAVLTNGLKNLHLNTVKDLLEKGNPEPGDQYYSTFYRFYFASSNHAVIDNSATVVAALAIADLDADYSASIIANAMNNLKNPMSRLAPDSMWFEGAGYWTFVGPFMARLIDALDSSIGTNFGYSDLPVIKNLGYFPIYQQSSQGTFVYCDGGDSLVTSPERYYFGKLNSDLGMQSYALATSPADPLLCLWYDSEAEYTGTKSLQKDMLYRGRDTVTMRSGWNDDALFAGMAVNANPAEGNPGIYQNSGTFVIDALGEQWIKNPGRDSYNLDGYEVPYNASTNKRWTYYCTRAEANSCIVINPNQYGGQNLSFGDTITGFDASADEAYAYANLAGSYRDYVNSYTRGIKMFDGRTRVLVKDEISLKEASEVYSFLSVYDSQIELLPDGSGAILSKGDKKMLVKIKANAPFELTQEQAVQKFSARQTDERDWTQDFDRLALHFSNATNLNISMIFAPFYGNEVPDVTDDNDGDALDDIKRFIIEDTTLTPRSINNSGYGKYVGGNDEFLLWSKIDSANGAYLLHKLPLGGITVPDGKKLKLELSFSTAYDSTRPGWQSGANSDVSVNFYAASSDWTEATTRMFEWCPGKEGAKEGLTPSMAWNGSNQYGVIDAAADVSYRGNFKALSESESSQNFSFDITSLYEKALASNMIDSSGNLSVITRVGDNNTGGWSIFAASAEHADETLRPYITVSFEDAGQDDDDSINNWTASNDDTPRLSELRIDGVPVADFDPTINYHKLYADSFSPAVTALSDDGSVVIRRSGSNYDITVTSPNGSTNSYRINIATLGTVEADTYVGGGSDVYNKNFGTEEIVSLKAHGTSENGNSSKFAYYKINIGDIPDDLKIKSISLELSCRFYQDSGRTGTSLSFYRTGYDEWQENTVICKTAPVNLAYRTTGSATCDMHGFPPKGYDPSKETEPCKGYIEISPDASGAHSYTHSFPLSLRTDPVQPAWHKEIIDITSVYKAGDNSDKLAFVITPASITPNYQADFASKEHSDLSLRPRVLIELEDKVSVAHPKLITNSDYTAGYSYANAPRVNIVAHGDTLRAVSSVSGFEGTMHVAQYDSDETMLSVMQVPVTSANANPVSDVIAVLPDAVKIKTFVWADSVTPIITSEIVPIS